MMLLRRLNKKYFECNYACIIVACWPQIKGCSRCHKNIFKIGVKSICVFHFRVSSQLDDLKGDLTEQVSFRTETCEPDPPATPKLSTRTKTSLLLKWNVSVYCNISSQFSKVFIVNTVLYVCA